MSKYSVVIPIYNSKQIIKSTVQQTVDFFKKNEFRYELILVNDHSKDNSWEVIKELAKKNESIIAIDLLKNYGQHSAIYCGFKYSTGDFIITMDDDMQNPPEEIIHLINKIHEGYDAVFGKFKQKQHSFIRKQGSKLINYLNNKIFQKPKDITLTNFRIIRREVVERIFNYTTNFPYIPGLVLMFSHKISNVTVKHLPRKIGKSNYTFTKIIKLMMRLLFNYSSYPIRFVSFIGFFIALISMAIGLIYLIKRLLVGASVPGWTTVVVLLSFLNGFTILMLGMLGEYIIRIMNQVSFKESYLVREVVKYDQE